MTKVKICCIQSITEAQLAIDYGAYAIGLVSKMPSGPGVISNEKIREVAKWTKGKIQTVLLTSLQNTKDLIEQHRFCRTDIIQLVDSQESETYQILKKEFPSVDLMQVIHVIDEKSLKEAVEISGYVDFILLDSGNPSLQIKELGGTGRTHNWELSKQIVGNIDIPVFLAGGLIPENVSQAITQVHPFGVDLCSGIRNEGNLVEEKLKLFMKNLK